ncbi:MAG: phasin family protein [Actinomycetota bacterium]|nr:phasin family protein [Actinomycetota bacterium]
MAGQRNKPEDTGVVHRLAGRGEDALTKIMDELGKNSRVTDALGRAASAKDKVDERTRKTLASIGVAAADEIKDLRAQLERLEKRLALLEGSGSPSSGKSPARRSTTSRSGTKKTSGASKRSTTAKTSGSTSGSGASGSSSSGSGEGSSGTPS